MKFTAAARSRALRIALAVACLATTALAPAASAAQPEGKMRRTPLEFFDLISEFEITKQDLLDMRRHLTNVRRAVGQDFAYIPQQKVEVVLSQEDTFRSYTNQPGQVSGLFDGRIHLPVPSAAESQKRLQGVLWHEYTHALIHDLAAGRCPLWLNEGFAMWEENRIRPVELDRLREAAAAARGRLPIPPAEMNAAIESIRTKKDPDRARLAYEQAYVFADFLFSRYSRANVRDFLKMIGEGGSPNAALKQIFGLDAETAEKRWLEHLKKIL